MNIDELLKKRLMFFFVSFIFIVVITISSSYAITINNVEKGKVINNGNLNIIYPSGEELVENCGYPLSYQQGNSIAPSNIIRVINNSNNKTSFNLLIRTDNNDNSLDVNKIYYSINDCEPIILGLAKNSIVFNEQLDSNEEYILDIKVWASSELINNEDQGKEINLIFDIIES